MAEAVEVRVPDIGDFADVPVIEVLVGPGDRVAPEDPLVTLESDKATLDIPAPAEGVVRELRVQVGDRVSEGSVILLLDAVDAPAAAGAPTPAPGAAAGGPGAVTGEQVAVTAEPAPAPQGDGRPAEGADAHARVLVIGGGPGGYTAAFRAADLGLETVLVERHAALGGVCLNVGCIPSKALLHIARVIAEVEEAARQGVSFGEPRIDLEALRAWKGSVVSRLTGGLAKLARQRDVRVLRGVARLRSPHLAEVEAEDGGLTTVSFDFCVVATGSSAVRLPGVPHDHAGVMDSTRALELEEVPERLLVIGGGIIGLEMATVYDALGSQVTVVELMDALIPGCDADLVRPLHKRIAARYAGIHLGTRVAGVEPRDGGLLARFEGDAAPDPGTFDRVLVAVGRRSNGAALGAESAGVEVDEKGRIRVDGRMRTNVPHIFAIGDVVGDPLLAHKAMHEGKVAAEVIAGHDVAFDARSVPSVAYTDPEVAWTGLTETEARERGVPYDKGVFPWAASGRALSLGRDDGLTKLLVDRETRRVLGAGMVGPNAGELIAEVAHAIEMGADAEDLALTIHPHPTLSETVGLAAEAAEGTITDLLSPGRRRAS